MVCRERFKLEVHCDRKLSCSLQPKSLAGVGEGSVTLMVRPERFELPTYCSGGNRSIHLSLTILLSIVYADFL
jgi:hypothetical protein